MKHSNLRNVQQFNGGYTDLYIIGAADLTINTAGVWSKGSDFTGTSPQTLVGATFSIGDYLANQAKLIVETPLAGPSLSAATLSVGITGTTTKIINAADVFTNGVAAGGVFNQGANAATTFITAAQQLLFTLTTTGAAPSALTAGRLWLYLKTEHIKEFFNDRFE